MTLVQAHAICLALVAADIVARALREQRLVLNATGPTTVRLLPPLVIDQAQADDAIARLRAVVH